MIPTQQIFVVEVAIEAKTGADRDRLASALDACAADDASFQAATDSESGQTILKGRDEDHLDAMIDKLRTHGLDLRIGAPQVAYRETVTTRVETDYTHRQRIGGTGQFARVKLVVEPNEPGAGPSFESKIIGCAVPDAFIPGVERGIDSVMAAGVLAGFPLTDVKVTLIDGAFHDTDSSTLVFEIASRAAFREAFRDGGPILLEPVMTVEVRTPEDYSGSVVGDLGQRGQVERQDLRGGTVVVSAMVPLANLFGYGNQLRSLSQGRASVTMRFAAYRAVPKSRGDDPRFPPAAMAMRA